MLASSGVTVSMVVRAVSSLFDQQREILGHWNRLGSRSRHAHARGCNGILPAGIDIVGQTL